MRGASVPRTRVGFHLSWSVHTEQMRMRTDVVKQCLLNNFGFLSRIEMKTVLPFVRFSDSWSELQG